MEIWMNGQMNGDRWTNGCAIYHILLSFPGSQHDIQRVRRHFLHYLLLLLHPLKMRYAHVMFILITIFIYFSCRVYYFCYFVQTLEEPAQHDQVKLSADINNLQSHIIIIQYLSYLMTNTLDILLLLCCYYYFLQEAQKVIVDDTEEAGSGVHQVSISPFTYLFIHSSISSMILIK